MDCSNKTMIRFIAIITFLASVAAMIKGDLATLPALFMALMLGILLVVSVSWQREDAVSCFLLTLFFLAALANVAYLYSVSGYLNLARLGTMALAVIGLVCAGASMMMEPVPEMARSEMRKLLAAEKKISEAREALKKIKEIAPKAAAPKKKKAGRRRKKK